MSGLGEKVRNLRLQRGLTLAQLGSRTGVSAVTIHNIEHGVNDPKISTLLDLCTALEVPLRYFIDEDEGSRFHRVAAESEASQPRRTRPRKFNLPDIQRHEMYSDSIREFEIDASHTSTLHLVFGRVEVSVPNRSSQLLPGDTLHIGRFTPVSIRAIDDSLLIEIAFPLSPQAGGFTS